MLKYIIAVTSFIFCFSNTLCGQESDSSKKRAMKFADKLLIHVYGGASISFCSGDYIEYQKSLSNQNLINTTLSSEIDNLPFFTVGLQSMYSPFYGNKGILSQLSFSLGANYLHNGFTSTYTSEFKDPDLNTVDNTVYKEKFRLNYLTIPTIIRFGKKVYGEVGIVNYRTLYGQRTRTVEREQSGTAVYYEPYNVKGKIVESIDKSVLNTSMKGFLLGAGVNIINSFSIRGQVLFSGKMLNWEKNFKSVMPQLQVVIPLYSTSFSK